MKFEQILVLATTAAGCIWLFDIIFLQKARQNSRRRNTAAPVLVDYAKSFFPILLLVLIMRSFIAEPFRIPSGSMKPSLFEGDFILVNKFNFGVRLPIVGYKLLDSGKPKRGDVVVFRHDDPKDLTNKDLIKRIVGLPGDHIQYKEKILYINGTPVELVGKDIVKDGQHVIAYKQVEKLGDLDHGIYTYPARPIRTYPYDDIVVPTGSYFVMGDNRDNSEDSRYWGVLADSDIIGRAFLVWWSWDVVEWTDLLTFWNIKVRWDRLGTAI